MTYPVGGGGDRISRCLDFVTSTESSDFLLWSLCEIVNLGSGTPEWRGPAAIRAAMTYAGGGIKIFGLLDSETSTHDGAVVGSRGQ